MMVSSLRKGQFQYPLFPFLLESIHILFAQDFLEHLESGGILFVGFAKGLIKLYEKIMLLQVVAKVAGLGEVHA